MSCLFFFGSTSLPIRTVFFSVSDGIGICPLMGSSVTLLSDSTSRNVHWGSEVSFFLYEVMGYNLAKEILSICALFVCLFVLDKIVKSLAKTLCLACPDCLLYEKVAVQPLQSNN